MMEDSYLFGLFVPLVLGFVFFKKGNPTVVEADVAPKPIRKVAAVKVDSHSGETGVSKYLESQRSEALESQLSGVEKYLQERDDLNDDQPSEDLVESGVAKYLAVKTETSMSGVSKYVVRQAIHTKKIAKENVSGVEKYLNNRD